jgi:hypothetical protein
MGYGIYQDPSPNKKPRLHNTERGTERKATGELFMLNFVLYFRAVEFTTSGREKSRTKKPA